MPILIRDKEVGVIGIEPKGEGFRVGIQGLIGTQAIVDSLREVPKIDGLKNFTDDQIKGIIRHLKKGWRDVDRYLTSGGIVLKKGSLRIFTEYLEANPELNRKGFLSVTSNNFSFNSGLDEPGFFHPRDMLYIAAPNLGVRLKFSSLSTGLTTRQYHGYGVTLPEDAARTGFLEGAVGGLSEHIAGLSSVDPMIPNTLHPRSAVMQRWYDHARKQVPVLEQM